MPHRFRCQRGQVAVEYLGVIVAVVALVGLIVLSSPDIGRQIGCQVQAQVIKLSGGTPSAACAGDDDIPKASTCIVSERQGEAGASVTVFSIKAGQKVKIITRRTADGHVFVTVEGGGEIGLEFGPPAGASASLDTGSTETTQGADGRGGVKLVGNGSLTWEFDNPDDAREFGEIVANKARDAALDTNPITGLGRRAIGFGEDRSIPPPTIFGLEAGVRLFGDGEIGAGPLSGSAEGEIGPSIGGRYDSKRKQTTVYYKVSASGKLGGELLKTVGGRGLAEGEVQLAVTLDSSGTPINVTAIASGTVIAQLTGKGSGLSGKENIIGRRADIRIDLDLMDPANKAAFDNFVSDPLGGAGALAERFATDAPIGARFYDASQKDVGLEATGSIYDIAFAADVGGAYKTADVQSAYYYDRETGSWKPWVQCK